VNLTLALLCQMEYFHSVHFSKNKYVLQILMEPEERKIIVCKPVIEARYLNLLLLNLNFCYGEYQTKIISYDRWDTTLRMNRYYKM
jgi:hypothetical protein